MSEFLSSAEEEVISRYIPVLRSMQGNRKGELISCILRMKRLGVESFATRIVYPDCTSALFSTSVRWFKFDHDEGFKKDYTTHLSLELVRLYKSNPRIITRSGDKQYSDYLKRLQEAGVNNSIITHEFDRSKIIINYFMASPNNPDARDEIINNFEYLMHLKKEINPALQEIIKSNEFQNSREVLISSEAAREIWNSNDQKRNLQKMVIPNQYKELTNREIECLAYLKNGSSNIFIAEKMFISIPAVKLHIKNLKEKLMINSREELIRIAQEYRMK